MTRWIGNGPCNKCASSDAKWEHRDGHSYCFSCSHYFPASEEKGERRLSRWNLEEIERFPYADLSSRGISKETARAYDVRQSVDPETGSPSSNVFFRSGLGNGWKRRGLTKKRDMEIIGDYSGLFGQPRITAGGKFLILTEGEIDALSVWQIFKEVKGKDYSVVSVPNGSSLGGLEEPAVYDFITSFGGVLVAFDQDEPGKEALNKFSEIFGPSIEIKYAEWEGANDVNELLTQGREQDFLKAVSRAREYRPETVVQGNEISLESLSTPIQPGHKFEKFPELSKKLGGDRLGELTTVIAPPGAGKSSFVAELGYDLIKNSGENVAWLFLEETKEKAAQRLIAMDNDIPLFRYRQNPSLVPEENRRQSYENLIANGRTKFVNLQHGILDKARLLPLLRWYHKVEHVTRFIFDHISLVFSADSDRDERKSIDNTLHELAGFVTEAGVSFTIVAHIKRMNNKFYTKDNDNNAQWLQVDMDQARGSGSFEQLSFNVITMEPEYIETGEKGRTRIKIAKNREQGILGVADIVKMDSVTGRLEAQQMEADF